MKMYIDHITQDLFLGEVKRLSSIFPLDMDVIAMDSADERTAVVLEAIRSGSGYRVYDDNAHIPADAIGDYGFKGIYTDEQIEWLTSRVIAHDDRLTPRIFTVGYDAEEQVGYLNILCDDANWRGWEMLAMLVSLPNEEPGMLGGNLYTKETIQHKVSLNQQGQSTHGACRWMIDLY